MKKLLSLVISLGLLVMALPLNAQVDCDRYYTFEFPREPQLYANDGPSSLTASEANGLTVLPGTYTVNVVYGDDRLNQGQNFEQLFIVLETDNFTTPTIDIPEDPNWQTGEWWWSEPEFLGNYTINEPITEITATHFHADNSDVNGAESLSVQTVVLNGCNPTAVSLVEMTVQQDTSPPSTLVIFITLAVLLFLLLISRRRK